MFTVQPMTVEHGMEVCTWKYPAPYDLYNWDPWRRMERNQYEFAHPGIREAQYRSVMHTEYGLSGFAQLFPMLDVTRLGFGMKPDLRGRGLGTEFVRTIVETARQQEPMHEIDLEVLTWNRRAIHVYEKAGFQITDSYDKLLPNGVSSFYCMTYLPK